MSLLNKNNAFNVRDYLFAAVGLLCLFWFFLSYASQEPRSTIATKMDKSEATAKAIDAFNKLGYTSENLQPVVTFDSKRQLLDSLQAHLGRQQAIATLTDSVYPGLFPFYWEMHVANTEHQPSGEGPPNPNQTNHTAIRLDEQGRLIEFINPSNIVPTQPVQKEALIAAFDANRDLQLWKTLPDSAWQNALRFDVEKGYDSDPSKIDTANSKRSKGIAHTFTRSNIQKLAGYHLQNSGWSLDELQLSEIQLTTINSRTAADIVFENPKPILGQDVKLELTLLPTGALVSMNATYNTIDGQNGMPHVLELTRRAIVFLFVLATIILFYFRIRSRAIDTKPALVVGVVAGLAIPALIFLQEWNTTSLFSSSVETSDLLSMALQMGFSGAFASIGFFAVFAVGDSLMRQYWPDKLYGYDFLRQGMFFNKPIGETILRSVVLAFILCGVWSTGLFLFPDLYLEVNRTFLQYQAAWSPIYLFINSGWFSFIMIVGVFAVVGTQIYGFYKNSWVSALIIAVGLMLMTPVLQPMGPAGQEFIFSAILGIALALIFLRWDILTTLFTHFLFVLMIEASSGWIIGGSPDLYIFVIFCGFLLFNVIAGILFITTGRERQSLPRFVPEYVEELAQEERIKQELQIAREVQQSFLPVATPEFQHLDLAAICKPAHETGGDYYDFVRLDDHRVAVTIGDVSGKGIQAAFYMTFIKGILHSLCREIDSPAEILKKTNRLFFENAPRGTFISLVYGILDLKKQTFYFARAGHNPILKVNAQKNDDVIEFRPKGIGIGLTQGPSFDQNIEEVELELDEDDLLVLYTDGIVEALNESHKFYGTQRLNRLLHNHKHESAANLLSILSKDIYTYIGDAKQHDDMTIVVMKLAKGDHKK